ncbi:MAG TPA: hypothetical protein VGR63_14295 [Casimicrobiaceae bacterium]|jgi:hypothetical protein|nr:hypothetical protein [Casimicrobiaceae bacterium]
MTRIDPAMRRALAWLVPIVLAAVALAAELDWGSAAHRAPPPETPVAPAPVSVGLLPDYSIAGGPAALAATSEHTLFNPTRQPAPPAIATAGGASGPSQMRRNQFVLTGTAIYGSTAVAYLKETAGGKSHVVMKGDKINGMLIADVSASGVRITQGGESEDLPLKVAAGPRTTVQPANPTKTATGNGGGAPVAGQRVQPGQTTPSTIEALAERRRAAREADAQRTRGQRGQGAANSANDAAASQNSGSAMQQLNQRSRNRGGAQQ